MIGLTVPWEQQRINDSLELSTISTTYQKFVEDKECQKANKNKKKADELLAQFKSRFAGNPSTRNTKEPSSESSAFKPSAPEASLVEQPVVYRHQAGQGRVLKQEDTGNPVTSIEKTFSVAPGLMVLTTRPASRVALAAQATPPLPASRPAMAPRMVEMPEQTKKTPSGVHGLGPRPGHGPSSMGSQPSRRPERNEGKEPAGLFQLPKRKANEINGEALALLEQIYGPSPGSSKHAKHG